MSPTRVAFHWSGGKDSALALGMLLADERYEVVRLVTTVHPERDASTVHGVPAVLLRAQARAAGIPLETVGMPGSGLDGYESVMADLATRLRATGVEAFGFGDLAASGVRELKERQLEPFGLSVVEPLWDMTSEECMTRFLASGIEAVCCVVDASVLDRSWVGRRVDADFVGRLPPGTDPCGELGEYHSFVCNAPWFADPVDFTVADVRPVSTDIQTTEGLRRYSYWVADLRGA